MFVVQYEMIVKEGCDQKFKEVWAELTEEIYSAQGSLGSRLHTTEVNGVYIAYAQWPSRNHYESQSQKDSQLVHDLKTNMRSSLDFIRVLHKLNVVDDRLR